jgi:hypothetical protein
LCIEKWLSSVLIGSLSSNSEAIVTAQTALSSNYWLSKQNGCRKSTCKQIIVETIEEIKVLTIPQKAKEAAI